MRVLHVITGLKVGGAERMLQKLAHALRGRGLDQRVVSLTGLDAIGPELLAAGFPVEPLGMRGPLGIGAAVLRLRSIIREYRPDVIQSWLYHADLAASLAVFPARARALVWGIRHSDLDPAANKASTLLVARACALLSRRSPVGIVCNSARALRTHAAIGYDAGRMRVIPNGFDTGRFRADRAAGLAWRARHGIPAGAALFGWVGRNHAQKAPVDFLLAAARLAGKRDDVRFALAGSGVGPLSEGLERAAADRRLEGRVVYAGACADMPAFYSALDAYVSSSLGEGFSNAIAEAMSCGVPVIATDAGDSAEIVSGSGYVCACGDPGALAERMEAFLAEDPETRAARGRRARAKVAERWSLDAVASEFEAYYRRVAGRGGAGGPAGIAGKDVIVGKGKVLESGEVSGFNLNPATLRAIEAAREASGKERSAFRILDFGCGRGRAVLALRRKGYDARGVDIDPVPIENGRAYLRESGEAPESVLSAYRGDSLPAADPGYDFCLSDQVLEHVPDLEAVAGALYRCLRPGGRARHVFPARWRPVEPHLRMPFFHWLPRRPGIRAWAARFWFMFGRDPRWPQLQGQPAAARARAYAAYTLAKTHYRPLPEIRAVFERQGFNVRFAAPGGSSWLAGLRVHLGSVHLDLEKPGLPAPIPARETAAAAA